MELSSGFCSFAIACQASGRKEKELMNLYDLTCSSRLTVSILPLGATIQKIALREKNGQEIPLALSFADIQPYETTVCYAGTTLGPNAGRLRGARLPILGKEYVLSENENGSQLHGGRHNLSSTLWNVDSVTDHVDSVTGAKTASSILLSAAQPDGLDGYPGNRRYQVRYTLADPGILTMEYTAWTDVPTYINLSNHTYWNLSGDFTKPALDQELAVYADQVCVNDENHLPVNLVPVAGTPFDFRKARRLSSAIHSASDPMSQKQLETGHGYNHAYLLRAQGPDLKKPCGAGPHTTGASPAGVSPDKELSPACLLKDPASGRAVEVFTDAPGIVLYSGGYLPAGLPLSGGQRSIPSCAVALEAQELPDAPRLFPDAYRITLPEKPFHRVIQYRIMTGRQ